MATTNIQQQHASQMQQQVVAQEHHNFLSVCRLATAHANDSLFFGYVSPYSSLLTHIIFFILVPSYGRPNGPNLALQAHGYSMSTLKGMFCSEYMVAHGRMDPGRWSILSTSVRYLYPVDWKANHSVELYHLRWDVWSVIWNSATCQPIGRENRVDVVRALYGQVAGFHDYVETVVRPCGKGNKICAQLAESRR